MCAFFGSQRGVAGAFGSQTYVPPPAHAPRVLPATLQFPPVTGALRHVPHLPPEQVAVPPLQLPQLVWVPFRHWQIEVLPGKPLLGTPSQLSSFPESHVSCALGTKVHVP